jgi:hypothetical protein
MPTRRTPRRWAEKRVITPAAIAAFARLRAARSKEEWREARNALHDALRAQVWEFPVVEDPREPCPFPPGCYAAERWQQERAANPGPVELWLQLERMVAARTAPDGDTAAPATAQAPRRPRSPRAPRNPPP